jgi:hypothetical protein
MGKEFTRADHATAGMLFMNDEGTENGGMILGGYKDANGKLRSSATRTGQDDAQNHDAAARNLPCDFKTAGRTIGSIPRNSADVSKTIQNCRPEERKPLSCPTQSTY